LGKAWASPARDHRKGYFDMPQNFADVATTFGHIFPAKRHGRFNSRFATASDIVL